MLMVLSPAKTLDYTSPVLEVPTTTPEWGADTMALIEILRGFTPAQIAELMDLSDALSALNVARYAAYCAEPAPQAVRAAVLAFDGDVYDGLAARTLDAAGLVWTQQHLRVLSGLYGVLRPLDAMQPYRLEMGTRLKTPRGRDLYAFWGDRPAHSLRRAMDEVGARVLVNLASEEYFKAVDRGALGLPIVQPVFQERRGAAWKVISFAAKRARGALARFAIDQRIEDVEELKAFAVLGYAFDAQASDASTWYFRRAAA